MSLLKDVMDTQVEVELSGNKKIQGLVVDYGMDILVVYREDNFYYIPLVHIQNLSTCSRADEQDIGTRPPDPPFGELSGNISFRKVLFHARGQFVELYVSGNTTIHGYLTSVMNDYFVFHSPVHKTVFITLSHVKWLVPYRADLSPYSLHPNSIPHQAPCASLPRTFKDLCKKFEGELVVFDMGDNPNKIGLLKSMDIDTNMLELVTANGQKFLWNLNHLKAIYQP